MIKLSIIIPCYNAEPYIYELLDTLTPQVAKTDKVEVILVDDGSKEPLHPKLQLKYTWLKIFRRENKGVSAARNYGLEMAKGEIIGFIDADDLVSDNYVDYILSRADEDWDYMDLSWKSLENNKFTYKLINDSSSLPNPSASTRVFKRAFIGDTRFPEKKDAAEDEHFTRHLGIKNAKHICATEYMYFYRMGVPNSGNKRFLNNECKTKRVAYYFDRVTKDMTYLIDEIKKEDEINEVYLLTFNNELPELEKYCQIWTPRQVKAWEKRGEPNNYISCPLRIIDTQIVLYVSAVTLISGIATFLYSFCKHMSKHYDIMVVYDNMPTEHYMKLMEIVKCVKNDSKQPINCDTLIMQSIKDKIPKNITYKQSVQMVHCIKQQDFNIPQDRDIIVNVSQASKDSFGDEAEDGVVIHNLTVSEKHDKALILVSSFRAGAKDKQGNDERCRKFAKLLDDAKIHYVWLYFSDKPMVNEPRNMIYCGYREDISPYVDKADYMVLLSGAEAFSYSLLEALELQTPVIVTPLEQNKDMQIVDEENGYIVPFEVDGFDAKKILKVPKFKYKHDNTAIVKQWRKLLGDSTPKGDYKPQRSVWVVVRREYRDLQLNEVLSVKDKRIMPLGRALELQDKGFVEVIQ